MTTTHPAVAFATQVADAAATPDGYIVRADLDMQSTDSVQATSAEIAQRAAIAKALSDAGQVAEASCPSEQHIRVLIGGLEIGPNGFVWQTLYNALNDLTHGPGPNNEVVKALRNAEHDLTQGPGPNNEIVKAARNAEHDLTHGPGPNNEVVKALEAINSFH